MNNVKQLDNGEMYIQESLICIDYLLKKTDTENLTGASDIIKYCRTKIGYEPRRQRIAKILNFLADNSALTRRLGFVVSSVKTGADENRKKFYISERLLTMQEINAIHIALINHVTPLTRSKRIEEIVNGLKSIFPTDFDKECNIIDPDYLKPIQGKGIHKDISDKLSRAFTEKMIINYYLKNSDKPECAYVDQIYYNGGNQYDIKMIDADFKEEKIINIHDIERVTLQSNSKINFDHQLCGNLKFPNSNEAKTHNFNAININKVMNYLSKPVSNNDKKYIEFKFNSLDIISSFREEFNIDLVELIYNQNGLKEVLTNNLDETNEEDLDNIKNMAVSVRVSESRFIKWATRPENILDIEVISPFELNNQIRNRINYINKLAQTKYNYIAPKQTPFLEIKYQRNNEITVVKIHSDDKEIVIPDSIMGYPITEIASYACSSHCVMEKLVIGNYVRTIGNRAFKNCENLKEIQFGERLETIGTNAFEGCKSLEQIEINAPIKYIYNEAFKDCTAMHTVAIFSTEPTYLSVSDRVFEGCISLDTADLAFISYLGKAVFYNCDKLNRLYLRCSPKVVIPDEYIYNPNTHINVAFNDYIPIKNPFGHLTSNNQTYFESKPWDWYEDPEDLD